MELLPQIGELSTQTSSKRHYDSLRRSQFKWIDDSKAFAEMMQIAQGKNYEIEIVRGACSLVSRLVKKDFLLNDPNSDYRFVIDKFLTPVGSR